MAGMGLAVIGGIVTKTVHFLYYPMIEMNENSVSALIVYGCYGALCLLPVAINVAEDIKWHYLKSKI